MKSPHTPPAIVGPVAVKRSHLNFYITCLLKTSHDFYSPLSLHAPSEHSKMTVCTFQQLISQTVQGGSAPIGSSVSLLRQQQFFTSMHIIPSVVL